MKQVLRRPEASGRLVKWAVELTQFDVLYQPRTVIKGQAMADFIEQCTFSSKKDWDRQMEPPKWKLPQTVIKGQALAYFIKEYTFSSKEDWDR